MRPIDGYIRLLHCITADNAEEFYRWYSGKKKKRKGGKYDYFYRMLGADEKKIKEIRRKKADYMIEYRRRKGK